MGKGPTDYKIVKGKTLTHAEFKNAVLYAVREALTAQPFGVTVPQVIDGYLDPEMKDPQMRLHVRNEMERMASKGRLVKAERGIFTSGASLEKPADLVKAELAEAIHAFAVTQGGWFTRADLLDELGRGDSNYFVGARNVAPLFNELTTIRRVWAGFYSLSAEERRQRVLEGRWVRMEAKAAVASTWLRPDDNEERDPESELFSSISQVQDELLTHLEGNHFTYVGQTASLLREAIGISPSTLAADPAIRSTLDMSLGSARGAKLKDQVARFRVKLEDSGEDIWLSLYTHFEEGEYVPHRTLRTPFYEALGAILKVDPVALSRGYAAKPAMDHVPYVRGVASGQASALDKAKAQRTRDRAG